ncbi:hypothetical protein [Plantactinospora sp. CA-290183]|uniref:hypothetical protein n=1 Tax=Plantactinospora sp. CA-290183 TaxID=3240006 RepID=UPI003D8E7568
MDETGQPGAPVPGEQGNGAGPHGDLARSANGWAADTGWSGAEHGAEPNGRQWQQPVEPAVAQGWGDRSASYAPRPLTLSPGIPARELRQPVNGTHLTEPFDGDRGRPGGQPGPGEPGHPYQGEQPSYQPEQGTYHSEAVSYQPEQMPYQPEQMPYQPEQMPYQPQQVSYQQPEQVSYQPEQVSYQAEQASYQSEQFDPSGRRSPGAEPTSGAGTGYPGFSSAHATAERPDAAEPARHAFEGPDHGNPASPHHPPRWGEPIPHGQPTAVSAPPAQSGPPAPSSGPPATVSAPPAAISGPPAAVSGPPVDHLGQPDFDTTRGFRSPTGYDRPVTELTALMPAVPRQPDRGAGTLAGTEQSAPAAGGWRGADRDDPATPPAGPAETPASGAWSSGWAPPWASGPDREGSWDQPPPRDREASQQQELPQQRELPPERDVAHDREVPRDHWTAPSWADQPAQRAPEQTGAAEPGHRDGYPAQPAGHPGYAPVPGGPPAPQEATGQPPNEPRSYGRAQSLRPDPPGYLPAPGATNLPPGPDAPGHPSGYGAPGSPSTPERSGYPTPPTGMSPPEMPGYQSGTGGAGSPQPSHPGYPPRREALALPTGSSYPAQSYREAAPPEPVAAHRPADLAEALPQRVPAEPDVPTVPEPPAVEPHAETPELARIATHLRREDGTSQLRERPDGFDVNAILAAVRGVAGVRDASLRTTPAGAHSLRLDLADGADPAEVSRQVARLLQERMGLAAAPQNLPGPLGAERGAAPAPSAPARPDAPATPYAPVEPSPAEPRPEGPDGRTEAPAEAPHRRRQTATHRGRAVVEESTGEFGGNAATAGTSYSGSQVTTTETAPSRPLNPGAPPGPRVIIDHVQVSTFGLDATVEVRLAAGEQPAAGLATGPAVDGYVLRLCAVAAAAAIDELLSASTRVTERGRCFVEHAAVVPFGSCEVATVVVLLVCDGWVEQLAGSALVAGDPRQAVVRATLAAVNRRLEALLA